MIVKRKDMLSGLSLWISLRNDIVSLLALEKVASPALPASAYDARLSPAEA